MKWSYWYRHPVGETTKYTAVNETTVDLFRADDRHTKNLVNLPHLVIATKHDGGLFIFVKDTP